MKKIFGIIIGFTFLISTMNAQTPWYLTGNTPTNANFIGSTNAADVNFRTSNLQRMTIIGVAGANQGFVGMNECGWKI